MTYVETLQAIKDIGGLAVAFIKGIFGLLPDVVWSGIVGSVITLVGVRATNQHHSDRANTQLAHEAHKFTQQLDHETSSADVARKYDVRQEVYIALYAQLVKANVMLAAFPQLSTEKVMEEMQNTYGAISKASVLAEQKTMLLLMDFQSLFTSLLLFANGRNLELFREKSEQEIQGEIYEKFQLEIKRVLSDISRYNESLEMNPERLTALQRSFEIHSRLSQEASDKRQAASVRFQVLLEAYGRDYLQKSIAVTPLLFDLFSAIRTELMLDTDIAQIRDRSTENLAALQSGLDDLFKVINSRRAE